MVGIVWGWTGGLHSRRRSCRTDCHGGVEPASGGEVTVACVAFLKDRPASTNRSASLTRSGQSADDPPAVPSGSGYLLGTRSWLSPTMLDQIAEGP